MSLQKERLSSALWRARHDAHVLWMRFDGRFLASRRHRFTRSVYGPEMIDHPEDATFKLCVSGYGNFIADNIAACDQPFVFLDIGANAGVFSMLAERNPMCRRIYAFEPVPATFRNLVINLARNRCSKVIPVCAAICNGAASSATMTYNPAHTGMARLSAEKGTLQVRTLGAGDLDRIVRDGGVPIIAKIDVEGSEAEVVATLRKTGFYGRLERMIVEVSARNAGPEMAQVLPVLIARDGFAEHGRSGEEEHYDALFVRSKDRAR